jgi:hypothetical protein
MEKAISTLNVVDWSRQKKVVINGEIGPDTRVGEVIHMAVNALDLPPNVQYGVFVNSREDQHGQKLNKSDTVLEAQLENDSELMIAPEVSAG